MQTPPNVLELKEAKASSTKGEDAKGREERG